MIKVRIKKYQKYLVNAWLKGLFVIIFGVKKDKLLKLMNCTYAIFA
tara:strand:- start:2074 stop:2211 length:138 start_codon:yes stop_codon:yes gene_type:complete